MFRLYFAPVVLASLVFSGSGGAQANDDPKPGRLDAHGDPLPKGAITRIGTARLSNGGGLTGLAFAPDGKTLASENGSGIVRIWDVATGTEIHALKPPVAGYGPLAYAPDGKMLASAAGGKLICLWEADTGRLMRRLEGPGDLRSIAFSPSSLVLATGSGNGSIVLWEAATGKILHTLKGHRDAPNGLAFTPDNKTLVSTGHDGTTRLWDVADGKEFFKFAPNPLSNSSLVLSGDGKNVITAGGMNSDGILRYWDIAEKRQIRQIEAHKRGALCLAISKDGKVLVSGGYDRFIRIWDADTTAELGNLPEQAGPVQRIALSPAGDLLAWGTGSRIHLGKITGLPKAFQFKELLPRGGHETAINSVRFSPDGKKLLTTDNDNSAILWDQLTGKELHRFHKGYRSAWSHDSKLVAFADVNDNLARAITIYDAATGKEVRRVSAPAQVNSIAFSADRNTLTIGCSDGAIHLLELATGKVRASVRGNGGHFWRAVLAPDGYTVAAVCDKEVRVLDTISGTELARVPASGHHAVFSPDATLLACVTYQDGIVLWDWTKGKQVRRIPGRVHDLTFTPDGQTLVAACMDETIRLWDVATGKELHSLVGHGGWILSVGISPDGRTLVSGSTDTTLLLWPLDRFVKAKPILTAPLSEQELKARLAKLPDGKIEKWWSALAEADARKAYRGMWGLVAEPEASMPILRKWVGPICETPIGQLIADLDHAEYARREAATLKLERLGRLAAPSLQAALKGKLSAEPRRRIERMLALGEVGLGEDPDEGLRLLRAVEVLERIGHAEARALLALIAKNSPAPEPGENARAALARLAKGP